jgi:hypothetical protein
LPVPNRLLYALVALVALAELAIFILALTPDVHPVYRAYFIDRTTTCLERRVSGAYVLGQTISFRPDGGKAAQDVKACGLSGPVGDGTHSIGTSSRLKLDIPPDAGDLILTVEATAARIAPQRVIVSANGRKLGEFTAESSTVATSASFAVPAEVSAQGDALAISLTYPDAFLPRPRASEIDSRAIKLLIFRLAPAAAPAG